MRRIHTFIDIDKEANRSEKSERKEGNKEKQKHGAR
jgi:hypothetical protein